MPINFCKLCNLQAPEGATRNPSIKFLHQGNSILIHFECIDRELHKLWNKIELTESLSSRGLKDHVIHVCKPGGLTISEGDFKSIEESINQDGKHGVNSRQIIAKIVIDSIVGTARATEEVIRFTPTELGDRSVPALAVA
jgi:hypothetical protein